MSLTCDESYGYVKREELEIFILTLKYILALQRLSPFSLGSFSLL